MSTAYVELINSDLAARAATEAERRASVDVWIAESDRLLDRLERLNWRGVKALPDARFRDVRLLARDLRRVGAHVDDFAKEGVQDAVDYLLDQLQTAAFALKWPGLKEFLGGGEEPSRPLLDDEALRGRLLAKITEGPSGAAWSDLVPSSDTPTDLRGRTVAVLEALESEGLVRWEAPGQGGGRRYFAVGEGSGGE